MQSSQESDQALEIQEKVKQKNEKGNQLISPESVTFNSSSLCFSKNLVTFIPTFIKTDFNNMLTNEQINHIDQPAWTVFMAMNFNFLKLLFFIQYTTIQKFTVHRSLFAQGHFNQLSKIKFIQLHTINLNFSSIVSIEVLSFIDAVNLKSISLSGNCIVYTSKAVNKLMFPQLRRLDLSQNQFKTLRPERCKASTDGVYLTLYNNEGRTIVQDISFFAPFPMRFPINMPEEFSGGNQSERIKKSEKITQRKVAQSILGKKIN